MVIAKMYQASIDKKLITPQVKRAFIITNSTYDGTDEEAKYQDLLHCEKDGIGFKNALKTYLGFQEDEILHLHDELKPIIEHNFLRFIVNEARSIHKIKKDKSYHGLFIIYYSGHGVMPGAMTCGVDSNHELIPLETYV